MAADQRQLENYGRPMVQQQLKSVTYERLPGTDLLGGQDEHAPLISKIITGLAIPQELYRDKPVQEQ